MEVESRHRGSILLALHWTGQLVALPTQCCCVMFSIFISCSYIAVFKIDNVHCFELLSFLSHEKFIAFMPKLLWRATSLGTSTKALAAVKYQIGHLNATHGMRRDFPSSRHRPNQWLLDNMLTNPQVRCQTEIDGTRKYISFHGSPWQYANCGGHGPIPSSFRVRNNDWDDIWIHVLYFGLMSFKSLDRWLVTCTHA